MITRIPILVVAVIAFGNGLTAQSTPVRLRLCAKPPSMHRLIGWRKYGLHFGVPKRGYRVRRGADVDYAKYVIFPAKDNEVLVLWFGGFALATEPDERLIKSSSDYSKVNVVDEQGATIGIDYDGTTANGSRWRQFVVRHEGAVYENVSPSNATLFDEIINSACDVPFPK